MMMCLSENQADEFAPRGEDYEEIGATITRSGRIIRSCYCTRHFPETANFQEGTQDEESRWMRHF